MQITVLYLQTSLLIFLWIHAHRLFHEQFRKRHRQMYACKYARMIAQNICDVISYKYSPIYLEYAFFVVMSGLPDTHIFATDDPFSLVFLLLLLSVSLRTTCNCVFLRAALFLS